MEVKRDKMLEGRINKRRRKYRCNKVVIKLESKIEVGWREKIKGLDKVMIEIGVDERMKESVEGWRWRKERNEKGLMVEIWRSIEIEGRKEIIEMKEDKVRKGIEVGLRVDDKKILEEFRSKGIVKSKRKKRKIEEKMGRSKGENKIESIIIGIERRLIGIVIEVIIKREIEIMIEEIIEIVIGKIVEIEVMKKIERKKNEREVNER